LRGRIDGFERPHSHFWAEAADGVRIAGTMLGEGPVALTLAHGFLGYRQKPKLRMLAERLGDRFTVFTFDLRGHGESGGACSGGLKEALDVGAIVAHARARGFERVVSVGASLGAIATLWEAATVNDADLVVSISAPASWTHESKAVRTATWLFMTKIGRRVAHRVLGARIDVLLADQSPESPAEFVSRIAPTPLLIVHGSNDHFFGPHEGRRLFEAAGEPKRLLELDNFGHAEDGFTPQFAELLADEIETLLARVPQA
jgi:pimeloyl-ACP methyl ester carboxylesterase